MHNTLHTVSDIRPIIQRDIIRSCCTGLMTLKMVQISDVAFLVCPLL